ncbi:MAG: hypothetical protein A2Y25_05405 [Candidatus Melainabacteria bacterium GWF2_37_15]|nr:MAG: hypothetical protein A2Y25_05405 [Candidatus Melainabacteria bacterium GWF2_37_15]
MGKKLKILSIILFIWLFALFIGKVSEKVILSQNDSFSVYKPGIEAIKNLKGTGYSKYIQRVYVNTDEKNKLMILIKPNYWGRLNKEEKDIIISRVSEKWKEIYKKIDPEDTNLIPEVSFANI